ncbi:carboxypeptidase S [Mycena polygramma]|nr:carboxypeptidase S [Mycena polygramma]
MAVETKAELPGAARPRTRPNKRPIMCCVALALFLCLTSRVLRFFPLVKSSHPAPGDKMCPQAPPLIPDRNGAIWSKVSALYATNALLERAVSQLSAAVQIPTETFDAMGRVGEDVRWESRQPFVEHLKMTFPLIHATLEVTTINTYGLLYIWPGSERSLKPILLMGHYDVVPVPPSTFEQWTHPPYSGHFDGENVWGRGSTDDKSGVIGLMTTIEILLEHNFTPARTIVLSFGFDEEAGGRQGAGYLSQDLLRRFGPNSFAMIVDEGSGYSESYGTVFAVPAIAEKASLNVEMEVQTPGGHSSVPPKHTSIGMLAAFIVHLETNPPKPVLEVDTPAFEMAQCFAAHGATVPSSMKRAISRARCSEKDRQMAEAYLLQDSNFKAFVGTTQVVDIVKGGVKSNALPEQAAAVINYRVATQSSVNTTLTRDAELVMDLAHKFNLSVTAYGERLTPEGPYSGSLLLSASLSPDPAPAAPINAPPFQLLATSIRSARKVGGADDVIVAPGLMTGGTDTRYYAQLSQHIFRYGHRNMLNGLNGIHGVNEHIRAESFVEIIVYFTALILNADEAIL